MFCFPILGCNIQDEDHLPQIDEQNKMLKEKLVSRLRFEPERTEVLLMVKGKCMVCEPADGTAGGSSELPSSIGKKYSILRTAVYRGGTKREHKAPVTEEDMSFGNVLSRIHKERRGESSFQPTSMSEHETVKLKSSITKPAPSTSEEENLKEAVPTTAACKEMQPGFGILPSSSVNGKASQTTESGVIKEPLDDDVIVHILRLRGKLGWQTKLPPCEWSSRETSVSRLQKFTLKKPLLLEDSGEFIYCLQRNRDNLKAPYNPYDLQVVSTHTAMKNEAYWTVTASFVSKFSAGNKLGEMETTPVPQWLRERYLFFNLLKINFFYHFRLMKCFLIWKDSVGRSKANKTRSV
ncbi:dynein axonemal heavy chain 14 isoform X3 [Pogoniulus pusillus]|uniref:dynein axonemal heavy chain 14 isoform X3 n=1 Tax=Pogoniulus pusillus TaxID=488313 RepID=UPI0030B93F2B